MLNRIIAFVYRRYIRNAVLDDIGGYLIHRHLVFGPSERLIIAPTAVVVNALFNTVSGTIRLDSDVFFGFIRVTRTLLYVVQRV